MKRVHTLEFEDLPWFPAWLRACMTNVIVVFARKLGVVPVLASLVEKAVKATGVECVVDLGSGSGGSMPELIEMLRSRPETADLELVMTDRYPNPDAIEKFANDGKPHVSYASESVDATQLSTAPSGLKTMVNCFHHMRPPQARAILASAHEQRQPILIYEMGENNIPFVVWCLFLPLGLTIVYLMALVLTLFVRPLTFRQVFFTYVIPLIPLFYAWDGQASFPRIYAFEDYEELLEGLKTDDYTWEMGHGKTEQGKKLGTYLLGLPK